MKIGQMTINRLILKTFDTIWYTSRMISLDHGEKITTGLIWLGGIATVFCFPLWAAPLVLLAYVLLVGPWLVVLLPVLVTAGIGGINLVAWLFSSLFRMFASNARRV